MKLSMTILDSDAKIRTSILDALTSLLNQAIDKAIPQIKTEIIKALEDSLKQEPEYQSLKSGKLRIDFGIPDTSVVDSLVSKLANTTQVQKKNIKSTNNGLSGGLEITAIESETISGLIADPNAIVQDSSRGYDLPWLEWLLLGGNSVIVKDYNVKYGSYPGSRTGDGIMVDSEGSWRVPAEFSGTSKNNWTTRAIQRIDTIITKSIQTNIERHI